MPDISLCNQKDCPKAQDCYRFTATPNEYRQSYIAPEYGEEGCKMFWEVKEKRDE